MRGTIKYRFLTILFLLGLVCYQVQATTNVVIEKKSKTEQKNDSSNKKENDKKTKYFSIASPDFVVYASNVDLGTKHFLIEEISRSVITKTILPRFTPATHFDDYFQEVQKSSIVINAP